MVLIKGSRKDRYMTIGCDRRGCYRNRRNIPMEKRQRKTESRLIVFPFQIQGKRQVDGFWTFEIRKNIHRHDHLVISLDTFVVFVFLKKRLKVFMK